MTDQKLLTVRDVAHVLGVSEKEVLDLAENGSIPAYKIAGLYLRFKKEQIEEYRKKRHADKTIVVHTYSLQDQLKDFFYYNDFYILSALIVLVMLVIMFK